MSNSTRRCSICDLNWPNSDDYKRCPQCTNHTSPIAGKAKGEVMSDAEAKSIAAHMRFDNFIENESEEDRRKRQEQDAHINERVDEAQTELIQARFSEVIRGAGFTDQEMQDIARYEAQLPMAHLNKDTDT